MPANVMTATIIDGTAIAREVYAAVSKRVQVLAGRGVRPGLAAVRFGEDPASQLYVRNKMRACAQAVLHSEVHELAADYDQGRALEMVAKLNADRGIHGILVQLPLPAHLDADLITQAIVPEKDVDGFSWRNLGALMAGRALFEPCTALGVVELLNRAGVAIAGSHAVIVGRSNIVGKPLALLLLQRGATVTVGHTTTRDLAQHTRVADVLVAAAGRPGLISAPMVKGGAAVIDVGINRLADGKLAGDVVYEEVRNVAGWITPVPGGVGAMTVAMRM